ncbi:MAG: 50S ribosomal protein L2 [Candidatus Thermoplasmatota archaeon]|nr:50S ribosomal protein L2 [Candidatus Thermoplasmatota archaeon]
MGKRIITRRRGKGTPVYRSPSHRHLTPAILPKIKSGRARVVDLFHDPGHTAPMAKTLWNDGTVRYILAPEGLMVGQEVLMGEDAPVKIGNILPLKEIPEGTPIYQIEGIPLDGGKFVRAGGSSAIVVSRGKVVTIQLPSGSFKNLSGQCRAIIGMVGGGGRPDLPFAKAGKKFHAIRSRVRAWPAVSGVAMSPVNHPHGGGGHQHVGKPSTVSRNAPPGRKVGRLSPKKKKGKNKKRRG